MLSISDMKRAAIVAVVAIMIGSAAARADQYDPLHTPLGMLPQFKLADQNGNPIQREQLLGKVCVISVFFSCCNTVCPITQNAMAGLQDRLAGWPDVLLISINVYPGHDSQSIIAQFAQDRHADPKRWLFLHGDEKEIYDLVQKGLMQALEKNPSAEPGNEVIHTPRFLVVDHRGTIRGYINDGRNPDEVENLEKFVKQLVQARYFPAVNAGLNGSCAVLLMLGFVFIRNHWITSHKICMLAAVVVSAVFLGSYLYYHIAVMGGQSTPFVEEGPIRMIYYGILISHVFLAVPVLFLALVVTFFGLSGRLRLHTALARWTLPVWLYVSITGVVVYWMLYHLYPSA
jgi:protein SCO1